MWYDCGKKAFSLKVLCVWHDCADIVLLQKVVCGMIVATWYCYINHLYGMIVAT